MSIILRDYQNHLLNAPEVKAIMYHLLGTKPQPDHMAPLIVAPTGSGKTRMFAAVARWCRDNRLRVYILVPRREILAQTVRALAEVGVTPGQIAAGRPMTGDIVQVASVQTIVNRLTTARKPDLIIVDEAHHSTMANSIGKILAHWPVPRLGFTATPQRLDGVGLRAMFDGMVVGPTLKWLVEQGFLALPVVFRPPEEVTDQFRVTRGDFDTKEQAEVMTRRSIVGNVISHYREHLDGAPTICACVSIEHAKIMADQFEQAGYRSRPVWGDMDKELGPTARQDAFDRLADGRVQVICFVDLISEGVDIPAVSGVILLRRTLSLTLYLQVVGRGLRPVYAPGYDLSTPEGRKAAQMEGPKPKAIILDHAGNYGIHGHPLTDRQWSLDSVRRKRGEKPPATVTCPKCYGVWPGRPRTCPNPSCGYSFDGAEQAKKRAELVELEGKLVEAGLDEDAADNLAGFVQRAMSVDAKTRQKMLLKAAFDIAEDGAEDVVKRKLKALAEAAGYSERWSDWAWLHMQKARR